MTKMVHIQNEIWGLILDQVNYIYSGLSFLFRLITECRSIWTRRERLALSFSHRKDTTIFQFLTSTAR